MIVRVLLVLFAVVAIATGTARACADVCCDPVAELEPATITVDEAVVTARPAIVETPAPPAGIAPAPTPMRVFRPPRTARV